MRALERIRSAWATLPVDDWRVKTAVLGLCLGLQFGFWLLLLRQTEPMPMRAAAPERVLELVLIDTPPRPPEVGPPPAARRTRTPLRSLRAVRIDPPSAAAVTAVPTTPPAPPGRSLSSQVSGLGASLGEVEEIGVLDPMRPRTARLPGRATAIVGGFHVRRERTPADVVRAIGVIFGGNYDPCPDLVGKMHDATIANPDRYSDAERRDLVERERGCRY